MKNLNLMPRIIHAVPLLAVCVMLMTSCIDDNSGYPSDVYFTSEGGSQTITGYGGSHSFFLNRYGQDDLVHDELDENNNSVVELDWVKVIKFNNTHGVNIVAQPNTTGKERKMYLSFYRINQRIMVTIHQSK